MPRYAPAMSVDDFKNTVVSYASSLGYFDEREDDKNNVDLEFVFHYLLSEDKAKLVLKDWSKVDFDLENVMFEGFNSTQDGIPYAELYAGGDWELPVYCIVYFDGKDFRGYVPKDGNLYNFTTKTAYGNDEDDDEKDFAKRYGSYDEDEFYNKQPELSVVRDGVEKRIVARGTSSGKDYGKSVFERAKEKEPDLSKLSTIPKNLVYFEIHRCADGVYFRFITRGSGRNLTMEEAEKLDGIHMTPTNICGHATWYPPSSVSGKQCETALLNAGFVQSPDNETPEPMRTQYIYLR